VTSPIPIGPTLSRIGQIFVNVHDLDRAIAFYRDTLGMTYLFQAPPNMAFFDCGGIRLLLGKPDRPDLDHPASVIYYKVDDIEKVYEVFKARGVEFIGPEAGMLACGYEGIGRLWKVDDIVFRAEFLLARQDNLIA